MLKNPGQPEGKGRPEGPEEVLSQDNQTGQTGPTQPTASITLTAGDTHAADQPGTPVAEADLPGELGTISQALSGSGCQLACVQVDSGKLECETYCRDVPDDLRDFMIRWLLDGLNRERIGVPRRLRTDQDPKLEAALNRARNYRQKRTDLADAALDLLMVARPVPLSPKTREALREIVAKLKAALGEMNLVAEIFNSAESGEPVDMYRLGPNQPEEPDEGELDYAAHQLSTLKPEPRDFIHDRAKKLATASTTPPREQFLWRTVERITRPPR
jgi:hypothetical protein